VVETGKVLFKYHPKIAYAKDFFGEVSYGRCYLARKTGEGGIFALDKELGLTRDGFILA
jgi:hypothetical protein